MVDNEQVFPKSELTDLEEKFLRQKLDSLDCFTDFSLKSGNIIVETNRNLTIKEAEVLPNLLDIWLKSEVELNIDIDLKDQIPTWILSEEIPESARLRLLERLVKKFESNGFKRTELEWRLSSGGEGFHVRVKDLSFPPKYVLNMRIPIGDCHHRLRNDREKYFAGLDCAFLYDMKKNVKAGEWQSFV